MKLKFGRESGLASMNGGARGPDLGKGVEPGKGRKGPQSKRKIYRAILMSPAFF